MKIRFLLDEQMTPRLVAALFRLDPTIEVSHVGAEGMPPAGTQSHDQTRQLQQLVRDACNAI